MCKVLTSVYQAGGNRVDQRTGGDCRDVRLGDHLLLGYRWLYGVECAVDSDGDRWPTGEHIKQSIMHSNN